MTTTHRFTRPIWLLFLLAPGLGLASGAMAQVARPLGEKDLVKIIEIQLGDDAIVAKVRKDGIGFAADEAAIARLQSAGASAEVLEAVRKAVRPGATAGKAVTYQDILQLLTLGIPESQIRARLEKSPTVFTLGADQVDELKRAGASEALLAALGGTRKAALPAGEVTDIAIILDCSASMAEATKEGTSKMLTAQRVVTDLIQQLPDGLDLAVILYGHNREQKCEAVKVARALSPLDSAGKAELTRIIAQLRPLGSTPIALSLRTAGAELAKGRGPRGVVLITDGKETCNGDPAAEAAALVRAGNLSFGINVVGFDVEGNERASLEAIARAGHGKYYNADSAEQLRNAIRAVHQTIEVAARPAQARSVQVRRMVRTIKLLPPEVELPPMKEFYVVAAGDTPPFTLGSVLATGTRYGEPLRIPADSKVTKFDVRWSQQGEGKSQVIARDVTFDETTSVEIRPDDRLGMVLVTGSGLPKSNDVYLTPVGAGRIVFMNDIVQTCDGFGKVMAVTAGAYEVRFKPLDDGPSETLVDKLEVQPGKLIKIE